MQVMMLVLRFSPVLFEDGVWCSVVVKALHY